MVGTLQHRREAIDQRPAHIVFLLELARPHALLQGIDQFHGRGHTEIGLDEHLFDLLEVRGLEPSHQRAHIGEHHALEAAPEAELLISYTAECHASR